MRVRSGIWGGLLTLAVSLSSEALVISEFLAGNSTGLTDVDGEDEDWIEIFNDGSAAVNLNGWHLTDDATALTKWTFPGVTLAPGQFLVVFASNKDRDDPNAQLHTNFKLSASGEYLGLIRPDGVTVEHDYGASYPQQVTDVSYGLQQEETTVSLVGTDTGGTYLVPINGDDDVDNGANLDSWIGTDFDDAAWTNGSNGFGYAIANPDPYDAFISTDIEADLYTNNFSVYIRLPFTVDDPSALASLKLKMNYDDGFVAYLNGDPLSVAEALNPAPNVLAYNSRSTATHSDTLAVLAESFPLDTSLLNVGQNVLCIHGMNRTLTSSDALFLAQLEGTTVGGGFTAAYFLSTSPGSANAAGTTDPGPLIRSVTHDLAPLDPAVGDLVIEADVVPTQNPIASVVLSSQVMYGVESDVMMLDDGTGADTAAGDGIFTAIIPIGAIAPGQMLRWKVEATDDSNNTSLSPAYPDPLDSPQYYGTIANDPSVTSSNLPVLHWFTSNPTGATSNSGSRGSVYYLGQFYDNIQADRHGQSTGGFPKKSYDFDFNQGDRFLPFEGGNRAKDINLITNWADKSKTRNTIGYEIMRKAGHPAHYSFPIRVQQNAAFFNTADLVEDGDDRYLDRVGLDGEGALYKMYNRLDSASSGINKKTRKSESSADLAALISGLGLSGDALLKYGYDNVNISGTINYLAALDMTNNRDHGHKNYYVYRDTNGTGEWRPLVWDIDLCLGRNWRSGPAYFDDVLRNNSLRSGPTNRLKEFVFEDPILNNLFRRRVRTLMDEMLGSPAAPVDYLSNRVNEIVALIDPTDDSPGSGGDDADLDYQKWGSWGNNNAMRPAADRILNEFIPTRRTQLYGLSEIPSAQSPSASILIGAVEFNPASNGATADQSGEYFTLTNPNNFEVDCSNWTITGGVQMTLPAGAVIPRNGTLHVGREAVGFRSRSVSPKADEKSYLVSGYAGQLSARGETLVLSDAQGNVVDSKMFSGSATPAQSSLRITELLYQPVKPSAAELVSNPLLSASDFEFIELTNMGSTALNLGGAQFVEGVSMTFGAGVMLAPGQRGIVVANQAAFELRYGAGFPILGQYSGNLDNGGESLQILDEVGENILEFSYRDDWYPQTDGSGYSLVLLDPATTAVTDFDLAVSWGVSPTLGGDPGTTSSSTSLTYEFWKNQIFSQAEVADPLVTGAEVDLDEDSMGILFEYAFGSNPRSADSTRGYAVTVQAVEGVDYQVMTFRRQQSAIDLIYVVEAGDDLIGWAAQTNLVGLVTDLGDGIESVTIRDVEPISGKSRRFMRLRVQVTND